MSQIPEADQFSAYDYYTGNGNLFYILQNEKARFPVSENQKYQNLVAIVTAASLFITKLKKLFPESNIHSGISNLLLTYITNYNGAREGTANNDARADVLILIGITPMLTTLPECKERLSALCAYFEFLYKLIVGEEFPPEGQPELTQKVIAAVIETIYIVNQCKKREAVVIGTRILQYAVHYASWKPIEETLSERRSGVAEIECELRELKLLCPELKPQRPCESKPPLKPTPPPQCEMKPTPFCMNELPNGPIFGPLEKGFSAVPQFSPLYSHNVNQ